MSEVLMTLGGVRFSVLEGAYQTLTRELEIRVAKADRPGRSAARQALGEDERIELEGVVYPGHAGADRLEALRALARTYEPQMLTDGRGRVWGSWLLERVSETASHHLADGSPQRQEFRASLGFYGEDAKELAA